MFLPFSPRENSQNFVCTLFRYKEIKIHEYDAGHMTKMAAMPIYGKKKTFKDLLLWNLWTNFQETWYVAFRTPANHSLFKWWPCVDTDLFYGKVKFQNFSFCIGKCQSDGFFENFAACDLEIGWFT